MQAIADFHGRAPKITGFRPQVMLGTIGDDVEACMRQMLDIHPLGYFAIRCEYMGRQDRPIEAKLDQLRGWGMRFDREGYEDVLESGVAMLGMMLGDLRASAARRRAVAVPA